MRSFFIVFGIFQIITISSFAQEISVTETQKEKLFIMLDTTYYKQAFWDPNMYFLEKLTPSEGIFFKIDSISLTEEYDKMWDLKEFVEPSQFYSNDHGIIPDIEKFLNYLNQNYIVYMVDNQCKRKLFYKVSYGVRMK
ncbi:hypothetical protein [Leeuwenhoekiella sp. MAR_2009_132]|uniref:hypothetical protein n=1 Tax=Leeuwenhoekiella sp. MAR_2009_132 TaxID=1392489 RepID=UPI00048E199B|nr:hypothetical protein [Leeuwenhoekiella sp. MAR_2009_132]